MKNRAPETGLSDRTTRRTSHVPTFEQCLTHIVDSVGYFSGDKKPPRLPAKTKQRFRQIDFRPEQLTAVAYRGIARKLSDLHLQGVNFLPKHAATIFEAELQEFLSRLEQLLRRLTVGRASTRQIRWSISGRFFAPWAALRIAFCQRHDLPSETAQNDYWFVPSVGGLRIGSCFMQVVDRHLKVNGESDDALSARICGITRAGSAEEIAEGMSRDFRRYRASEGTASDGTLNSIFKGCAENSEILAKAVLARAIDRNVQDAIGLFGQSHAVNLVRFFRISLRHFRSLLNRLNPELPQDDRRAWEILRSQTFTGNTPFEAERFYPLTDPYLDRLAQIISTELTRTCTRRSLTRLPVGRRAFDGGHFPSLENCFLPRDIELAIQKGDFPLMVRVSESLFTTRSGNPEEAARMGEFFSRQALPAYDSTCKPGSWVPNLHDAEIVMKEGFRLLSLAHANAQGAVKVRTSNRFLRILLVFHRPKLKAEHPLAWKLYREVARDYRRSGMTGSSAFLRGCLLWLGGKEMKALDMFLTAAKCGRTSCGNDWVPLLQLAPVLAAKSSKRALNWFLALSEREGVSSHDPTPRTNIFVQEIRQRVHENTFNLVVRPFPTV